MNQIHVSGKTVLLAGGAGGLGAALATLLIQREAAVFICDKNQTALTDLKAQLEKANAGAKVGVAELDVRDGKSWDRAWEECESSLGSPSILVNIAGVKGEEDWSLTYDVNVKGVHHGIETAVRHLSKEKGGPGGVVVNISSTCGVTCLGDMFATPAYTASKHAVTALTRTFGHKFWFSRTGVSVVGVAPYYIDTPFLGDWPDWTPDQEAQQELEKSAAGKKFLTPSEAALKIFNTMNSASGSIWLLRPGMLPPFNIPDYKLPQTSNISCSTGSSRVARLEKALLQILDQRR